VRPYFEGKYLLVGAALCGGRAYSMLKSFYMEILKCVADVDDIDVYNIMSKMLSDRELTDLTVDTRFAGTRINPEITGGISNITVSNFTPFDLTRGFIEGIINELHDMYLDFGIKANGIVGSGNGIRKNRALIEIAEKKFSLKMQVPCHTEEAAMGATMFALIAVGYYKNIKEAVKQIKYT
jgi:sedoheptulokinase